MNGPKQQALDLSGLEMGIAAKKDAMGQQQAIDEWQQKNTLLDYALGTVGAIFGGQFGVAGAQAGFQVGEALSDLYSSYNVPDLKTDYTFNLDVADEAMQYMESAGFTDMVSDFVQDFMIDTKTSPSIFGDTGIFADKKNQSATGVGASLYNIFNPKEM